MKRTAMKRSPIRRKSKARKLKQNLDLQVKAEVLERDGYKCVRCGKTEALCASHVYPKGKYPRLRFMTVNLLSMCTGCHLYWWHKSPVEAAEWFLKTYPERAQHLKLLAVIAPRVDLRAKV